MCIRSSPSYSLGPDGDDDDKGDGVFLLSEFDVSSSSVLSLLSTEADERLLAPEALAPGGAAEALRGVRNGLL
jgi:hypothetical protein